MRINRLPIFMTNQFGGISSQALVQALKLENHVGESAEKAIMSPDFQQPNPAVTLDLVVVASGLFQREEEWVESGDMFSNEKLRQWSLENLSNQVIQLCPQYVGPYLRGYYREQPMHSDLYIASDYMRIYSSTKRKNRLGIFHVGRNIALRKYIRIHWTRNGERWNPAEQLVFQSISE